MIRYTPVIRTAVPFLDRAAFDLNYRNGVEKVVEDFFKPRSAPLSALPMNVYEKDDELLLEVELPGVTQEDLDLSVVSDTLTLSVKKKVAEPAEGTKVLVRERGQGEFTRTAQLPYPIDSERVEATLKDGILSVKLPKAEVAKKKKIQIQ